jgi:hypothetical protein
MGVCVDGATEQAYGEVRERTREIESQLSESLNERDLVSLRDWCFDYAEKKARHLEFSRQDPRRAFLHTFVRYELMNEARILVEGVSDGSMEKCSRVALGLLKDNDIEPILESHEELL